ncbi:gamma-glutamyltransferase [Candidatus Rariloculus sp.]|uniref:gamma-glutamyltransferase n=1 Tax=Candidatus Rariloculus sp. TaxID=3101265 RepID=UPI003D126DFD
MAKRGIVATSQPLASALGLDILRRGGTAVDAAIGANAALGLMEPTGCGIGGDLFAIVWDESNRKLSGLNASGRSPLGLTREHFETLNVTEIPSSGPFSVSVPGAVDGWFELHERFGRLSMREILGPSIEYAREGFPVSELIAVHWAADVARLGAYPGFAETFAPAGRAPAAGDTFRNPRLAEAYEILGSEGRGAFYDGEIAASIVANVEIQGGCLGRDDLRGHVSEWVDPVSTNYRGYDVWELPPNGQGIAVLQMLNLLEGYDLGAMRWGSAEHLHLLVETKKLAFEDRARHYADPAFADVPVTALIGKEYAALRRRLIRPDTVLSEPSCGDPRALEVGDTVYLAAADAAGNMVSLIQSNYRGMGSGVVARQFGFVLQNRGEAFTLERDHPNAYAPGKRPFHTIIPGFLTRDGHPVMAFGVMGAAMQPQGQVQVLSNIIDFGMNAQEAGDAPRVRHDGSSEPTGSRISGGGTVHLESGFAAAAAEGLATLGHVVSRSRDADGGYGGYQAIMRDAGRNVYMGASESRKDGCAAGF